ncbi:MAG: sulfite exporter TauE/SafE family protein [Deltaproteobacteria bacterium]|nr:sulfite exporter TauE/SafE family protein [Deltaproteobacteria bacterium]MCL5277705.1 sulfite exporter TauE/SafE family protein [Deltaproteobacteria bacterium]
MTLIFLISLFAGFIGALSGMGGGIIIVPALVLLGIDIKYAIAASMLSVIATSCSATAAYAKEKIVNIKIGTFLQVFTILGAIVGATLTLHLNGKVLSLMFGLILLSSWIVLLKKGVAVARFDNTGGFVDNYLDLSGCYEEKVPPYRVVNYKSRYAAFGGPFMFMAGVVAGLLGIGAGALKVLILDLLMGLPPKVSTTTSNYIIGITALAGSSVFFASGYLKPGLAVPIILGVLAGSWIGSKLLVRMVEEAVRKLFLVILLVISIEMIWRGI